jgi:hypothetical protein
VKISAPRAVIALFLLIQIAWLFMPNLNTLADPYRHDERQKALEVWVREKTPESKVVADRERHLLYAHRRDRALLRFTLLFVIDGAGIYYFWNYGINRPAERIT